MTQTTGIASPGVGAVADVQSATTGRQDGGPRQAGRRTWRGRAHPESVLGWAVVAVLAVLVGLPLVLVLLQGVVPGIGLAPGWTFRPGLLAEIFERRLWQRSLANSLVLASGTMVLGGAFGAGLAVMRHSASYPGARLLDATAWFVLVSPSFVLSQGWVLFASRSGVAAHTLGQTWVASVVFSRPGLILVMTFTQFPLAYLATSAALRWDDASYRHAAMLSGAGPLTVLRTVRLPLLAPAIASGAVLVFVDTLGDFGLPAALATSFQFPTLPYSIYASVRQSPVSFALAGVLSLYLVVILAGAIAAYLRLMRRSRYDSMTSRATDAAPPRARRPWVRTLATLLVLGVVLGIPIGSSLKVSLSRTISGGLDPGNFTLDHYREVFAGGSRMLQGAANSLTVALSAAAATTLLGFAIAVLLTFTGFRGRAVVDAAGTVTLAIPGIVLAVGYIFVWNQPALERFGLALYGRPVLLVLAAVAAALPISVRLQLGAMAQVPRSFLAASALSGVGLAARLRTILVPLTSAAVVSSFAAVLASSVFDLAAATMLAPPNFVTLPVEILLEFDRGRYGYATAGALVSAALVVLTALIATRLGTALLGSGELRIRRHRQSEASPR